MEMKQDGMAVEKRRMTNQRGAGGCLVLCCGTDSARLAVPCYRGGCRMRTGMTGTETSLSRWNEGTR